MSGRYDAVAASRRLMAAAGLLPLLALVVVLFWQHVFDVRPCPWCVLQRAEAAAITLAAALAWLWRSRRGLLASAGLVIALANLGVLSALWQHFVAAASASCNLTLADRIVTGLQLDSLLPDVFAATASCAEAKALWLGLPYEFWSLAVFVVVEALAVWAVMRSARRAT
ncbi:MAG TPA: disulfide bond formation protein B [Burkholderiaceae bacterium]|nr:disulfide bond formation protein B [Burkholderiaceae bacterium]